MWHLQCFLNFCGAWTYLVSEPGSYDLFDGLGHQGVLQFTSHCQGVGGARFAAHAGTCGHFDATGRHCGKKMQWNILQYINTEIKRKIYKGQILVTIKIMQVGAYNG